MEKSEPMPLGLGVGSRPGGFLLRSSGLQARAVQPGHAGLERVTQRAEWAGSRERRCPGGGGRAYV